MKSKIQHLMYSCKTAHTVLIHRLILHFSYDTLVAVEVYDPDEHTWVKAKRGYISTTTSRHINQLFGGKEWDVLTEEQMDDLIRKYHPTLFNP